MKKLVEEVNLKKDITSLKNTSKNLINQQLDKKKQTNHSNKNYSY